MDFIKLSVVAQLEFWIYGFYGSELQSSALISESTHSIYSLHCISIMSKRFQYEKR